MSAIDDIAAERQRQISVEGWTPEHDDEHNNDELVEAAACYAMSCNIKKHRPGQRDGVRLWPWDLRWLKPKDRRSNLVRAAALIVAEIERLDRVGTKDAA